MRGSLQIARLFGIPVNVHWSFSLLFLFVAYMGYDSASNWKGVAFTIALILALFFCVVLHEFGHALSARYYGVGTKDITILPIGGVARLDKLPEKPFQEFVVAVMGPMVNVVICVLLALITYFKYDTIISISDLFSKDSDIIFTNPTFLFLITMLKANAWLVAFNMIPAFPMDGGRVFRALLSLPLGRTKATRIAAMLGQICAVGFFIYGVMEMNPVLSLVSVFIFFAARQEYQYVLTDEILATQTVGQSVRTQFTRLRTDDAIFTAASELKKGVESDFLVFDDTEQLRGVLQDDDILDALKHKQFDALVSTYTTVNFHITQPFETLKEAYNRMLQTGQYLLPVMDGGALVGVLDMTMIQNYIKLKSRMS